VRLPTPSLWPTIPTWLWIVLIALVMVVLNVATIAACGAWDPWETHYGEVARQILVRDDPIDLWWRPGHGPDGNAENTFWSKPALPFWLMALSMALLGVGSRPAADEMVRGITPELALRLPSMLAGTLCAAFLGYMVWRLLREDGQAPTRGPSPAARAGMFTAVVLATMPQWAIVTRQALTDMFFVAPVVVAMGAWALAWMQPDRTLRRRAIGEILRRPAPGTGGGAWGRVRRWTVPWDRAYTVFLIGTIAAAIVPLTVLHMHVISADTVARVAKFVKKPGVPNIDTLRQIHLHMFFYWGAALVVLITSLRWARRSQVWVGVLYVAAGVSLMGKGMIGPGIVGLLVLVDMIVRGRFDLLRRCGLGSGILLFALASLPWHHAMAIYRGERWVNELIIVNNLARFGSGEQEQAVGSFAFYLRTLGLAAFPWAAAVPAALWSAMRRLRDDPEDMPDAPGASGQVRAAALRRFALLWAAVTLALLSYSVTKYYHYLLPVLPPLAVLLGLWLAEMREGFAPDRRVAWVAAGAGIGVLGLVLRDVIVEPAWIAHLTTYLYDSMWRQGAPATDRMVVLAIPFALGLLLWAAGRVRAAAASMLLSALLIFGWTLNGYLPAASEEWSQRSAIRTYYDQRGPEDPLLSWWFYYRGETFYAKANVWVLKENDREQLAEFIDTQRGHGRSLWLMTTAGHSKRARTALPSDLRAGVTVAYENSHYALLRVPVP
jgi:4-amino-4-deoxy-L-arabinose transferase-like glycosyltransferase